MKALNARQILTILERHGFVKARHKGSHHIYKHSLSNRIVPLPVHKLNKPLKIGTQLAIIKQSGIERSEFEKLKK